MGISGLIQWCCTQGSMDSREQQRRHHVNTSNTKVFMAFLLVQSFITCAAKEALHIHQFILRVAKESLRFYELNRIKWSRSGNYTLVCCIETLFLLLISPLYSHPTMPPLLFPNSFSSFSFFFSFPSSP